MKVPMLLSVCVSVGLLLLVSCPAMVTGQMTQSLGWGSGGAYGRRSVESNYDDCVFDLRLLRIKGFRQHIALASSVPMTLNDVIVHVKQFVIALVLVHPKDKVELEEQASTRWGKYDLSDVCVDRRRHFRLCHCHHWRYGDVHSARTKTQTLDKYFDIPPETRTAVMDRPRWRTVTSTLKPSYLRRRNNASEENIVSRDRSQP
ncbi:hypothetical protein LSAT2_017401 [Lamellibrachia satsuma]|nr:hypothetical protein LSAT2_017401 [Lamellibrachia satsuma]